LTGRLLGEFRRPGRISSLRQATRAGANLTSRETDVLELLVQGLGTAEVGQRLFLAAPTVRSHVAALMRKFAVRDRDALRALFDDSDRLPGGDRQDLNARRSASMTRPTRSGRMPG